MRTSVSVLLALAAMAGAVLVSAEEQPREIVVPEKVKQVVEKENAGFKYYRPAPDAVQVADSRVPTDVKAGAEEWVRKVVRKQWLPDSLQELMKGITWTVDVVPPHKVDYLVMEYGKEEAMFRIVEGAGGVTILWQDAQVDPGEDPGEAVKQLAKRVLMLPDNRADELEVVSLKDIGSRDEPVFKGYLAIPRTQKGAWPIWYNRMTFWVAKGYLYVSVPENTGKPPEHLQARPGSPRRFL
jgi:hypothetical protein